MSTVHQLFPGKPQAKRRRRVVTEKAEAAIAGFDLAESALRHALVEHLPFSGLPVTPAIAARLRAIADEIGEVSALLEAGAQ